VPGTGLPVRVHDNASGAVRELTPDGTARMYVCGITPYDATHIGHAATYVTFDLLGRALRDAGHEVLYVKNITDVGHMRETGEDRMEMAAIDEGKSPTQIAKPIAAADVMNTSILELAAKGS